MARSRKIPHCGDIRCENQAQNPLGSLREAETRLWYIDHHVTDRNPLTLGMGGCQDDILAPMLEHDNVRAFPGIPSLRLKDPQGPYVQGMDRFIEGMRGEEYTLVTIAEPISLHEIDAVIDNLFELNTAIHSQVRATVQKMKGSSDTINVGMFGMSADNTAQTDSMARTDSESTTEYISRTDSDSSTEGKNYMESGGVMQTAGTAVGGAIGATIGGILGSIVPGAVSADAYFMPDLHVFTLGSEMVSPFRINPFEFSPGSELLTHIDSIKAVFNAAFPMYASMPYILEEAIILSAIYQYRENFGGVGSPLNHILLIEEAHRLLRRTPEFTSPEVGNSRGKAVETFTNVIADDDLRRACYLIYYANLFFGVFNESFPGCYDQCLQLQRIFIDLWFVRVCDVPEIIQKVVIKVTGAKSPLVAFLHKYVKEKAADKGAYFKTLKSNDFQPQTVEALVVSMIDDILFGIKLSQKSERNLSSQLLEVLLCDNPEKQDMLNAFLTR